LRQQTVEIACSGFQVFGVEIRQVEVDVEYCLSDTIDTNRTTSGFVI